MIEPRIIEHFYGSTAFLLTYANIIHFVKSTYSKLMKIVETKELNVLNRFIMVLIQKQMNLKGK